MPKNHFKKYASNMLLGIILVTAGTFLLLFIFSKPELTNEWYLWAVPVAVILNAGIIMFIKSAIHKVKADLIRKQRQHEQHKTFTADKSESY